MFSGRSRSGQVCVLVSAFVAIVMCVPASSCWSQGESASITAEESVLRIGTMDSVDSLNPFLGLTDTSRFFYSLVYDSLFSVGNDLETVGNLATSWWIVPESAPELVLTGEPYGSVWDYNITANAVWHDGEPFTVDDVVWNLRLNSDNYEYVWAYQPYSFFMNYAEAVDEDTVRVHYYNRSTGEPTPVAYGNALYIPMVPEHMLSSMEAWEISYVWNGTFYGYDPPMVGTGPFMATSAVYDEYTDGNYLTLVRNPNYHWTEDKGQEIQFDRIVFSFYDDATALALALEGGLLDIAELPTAQYDALKDDVLSGDIDDIATFDGLKVDQYWTDVLFNMNDAGPNPIRLDSNLRLALAMATNKTYITETFYQGYAEPGSTLISPVSDEWHCVLSPGEIIPYDLDLAALTLEESGYIYTPESPEVRVAASYSYAVVTGLVPVGTPLSFDMLVRRESPEEHDIAQYLQTVWWEIGVDINYRIVDEATMASEVYAYEYDMAIWCWSSDPDPNCMLFCQSKYAWGAWSDNLYFNSAYDASYNASVSAMDPSDRKWYVDDCQRTHYNDVGYIVMAYVYQTYAFRTDTFTGWGDWETDPGRSLDAYWGANPLLFDLVPIEATGNSAPTDLILTLPTGDMYAGCLLTFTISAEDADMDPLMLEVDFGDGMAEGFFFLANESTHYEATFIHEYEAPGDYDIRGTADDQTGIYGHVIEVTYANVSVLGDTLPPETEMYVDGWLFEDDPEDPTWYWSSVEVGLVHTDDGTGVATTEWSLDGSAWTEYEGPVTVAANGENYFEYRSTDLVGNVEDTHNSTIRIDTDSPSLTTDRDTGFKVTEGTVVILATYSDAVSGVVSLECELDGVDWSGAGFVENEAEIVITGLADGTHTIVLTVRDAAGHETSVALDFEVETSLFALDGPAGPWIVVGMLLAIIGVIAVASALLFRRMKAPKA